MDERVNKPENCFVLQGSSTTVKTRLEAAFEASVADI